VNICYVVYAFESTSFKKQHEIRKALYYILFSIPRLFISWAEILLSYRSTETPPCLFFPENERPSFTPLYLQFGNNCAVDIMLLRDVSVCIEYPIKIHSSSPLVSASNNTTFLATLLIARYLASRKHVARVSQRFVGPRKTWNMNGPSRPEPIARAVVTVGRQFTLALAYLKTLSILRNIQHPC
jgi:hypothetical protein